MKVSADLPKMAYIERRNWLPGSSFISKNECKVDVKRKEYKFGIPTHLLMYKLLLKGLSTFPCPEETSSHRNNLTLVVAREEKTSVLPLNVTLNEHVLNITILRDFQF